MKTFGAVLVVVVSAACSKSTGNAAPAASADATVAIVDAGPLGPKVTLDVSKASPRTWTVTAELLPAISEDRTVVAMLVRKEDGTRMYPNGALELRTVADDKVTMRIPILEGDPLVAAEDAPDAFHTTLPAYKNQAKAKLDEANALLEKTKWIAMNSASANASSDAGVTANGFSVTLAKPNGTWMIVVTGSDTSKPLLSQDAPGFFVAARKPPKPQKGNPLCKFSPFVAETAAEPAKRDVIAVRIAQSVEGNVYGCFEPSQWHVYKVAP